MGIFHTGTDYGARSCEVRNMSEVGCHRTEGEVTGVGDQVQCHLSRLYPQTALPETPSVIDELLCFSFDPLRLAAMLE